MTYGLGEIDATKAFVTRERNGNYLLYLEYPSNGPMAALFSKEMKIKADAGVRTKNQTFEISRIIKDSAGIIKIHAKHISHKLEHIALKPKVSIAKVNAQGALTLWKQNLVGDITFDVQSDITTEGSTIWTVDKVTNARQALGGVEGSILDVWGGEYAFDNTRIILHKQMGRKSPTVLEYGRNIIQAEDEVNIESTYTSIYPYATYTPDGENKEPVIVTLPELYVDSSYIRAYAHRRTKIVDLSSKFGEKEIPTPDKLRYLTYQYIESNGVGQPDIQTKIEYIDLSTTLDYQSLSVVEEIELCDIVPIYYPSLGITSENGKVVSIQYNVLLDRNESIEIGTLGKGLTSSLTGKVDERISILETKQKTVDALVPYLVNASGNRIWYEMPPEGTEHKVGDIRLEKNGQYDRMYVWNGELWEKRFDTEDVDNVKRLVEDLETKSQEMESLIAESDEKVKQALESVKVNRNLAEEAQRLSEMTRNEFTTSQIELGAHYKRFNALNDKADKLKTEVSGIQTDLDGLSSTVNQTMLDPETGLLTRLQNEQKQTADTLKSKLSSAEVSRLIDGKNLLSIHDYTNDKTETARGIEQKLSELRSKIPTEIGGRNYVRGSADMALGSGRWDTGTFRQSGAGLTATVSIDDFPNQDIKKAVRINRNNTGSPGITQDHFALSAGDWTLSWWVKAPIGTQFRIQAYWSDSNNRTGVAQTMTSQTDDWQRVHFTTTNEVEGNSSIAYIYLVNGSEMLVTAPKLEKGRVLTDWSPAPEDNQIDQEAFSNLKRTASLTEQIFGSRDKSGALTNLSREIATSEIFQREVIKLNDRNNNLVVDGKGMEGVKEINIRNGITKYEDTIQPNGFRTIGIEAAGQTAYRWAGISLPLSVDGVKKDEVYTFYAEYDIEALPDFDFVAQLKNQTTGEIAGSVNLERGSIRRYNQSFKIHVHRNVQNPELYLYLVKNGKVRISQPVLLKGSYDDVDSYVSSGVGSVISARMSQIAGSFAFNILKGSDDILAQLNLNSGGVKIDGKLVQITGETFIDKGVIKSAHIQSLDASKITAGTLDASKARIINLDINTLTGNKANLLQTMWQSTNSYSYIDGTKIQVRGSDGSYVEMNNIPEFRSSDPTGTATVIGMGRTHYLDKDGVSLGYIGMNLYSFDYNGARVPSGSKYGVWLSRGSGGFSINYMQDGGYVAGSENVYYTVPSNGLGPVNVIENVMRWKKNQGNWAQYEWVKSELARLNGYGAWPWSTTFRQGDRVIIEKGSTSTYVPAGYKRYLDCTISSNGTHTIYTYTETRMQESVIIDKTLWVKGQARVGSLKNDSDRKLKENIKEATSSALNELMALKVVSFDWKETGQHQRYGLIAQDSGKFRVKGETEGVNLTELIYASVKAIQELSERMDVYEARSNG